MPPRDERGVLGASPWCLAHGPPRAVPFEPASDGPVADPEARRVRDEMLYIAALCDRELAAGALSRAGELAQAALDREQSLGENELVTPFYVWGVVLAERGEPAAAWSSFDIALERAERSGHRCCALLTRALMVASLPDEMAAPVPPDDDDELPGALQRSLIGQRLREIRAATALLRGDRIGAAQLAERLPEPHRSLLTAKLCASTADTRGALAALDRAELVTTRHRLDALLLRAFCAKDAHERIGLVREALEVAEPDHYKRRFVHHREWIASALSCIAPGWPTSYVSELVDALEGVGHDDRPVRGYGEELTPREWEVLGHLGTRRSIPEIGAILYISANTVKSHVRSIYRKLGVRNRLEADAWQRAEGAGRG